jgi:fatty acid synthase subunit beta
MYRQLWTGGSGPINAGPSKAREDLVTFDGTFTCDETLVREFNRAVDSCCPTQHERVPLDFAIVVGWSPICQALLQEPVQGNVLNLVHLSNSYEMHGGTEGLNVGDKLQARSRVVSTTIDDSGKTVEVVCDIKRASRGATIIAIRPRFLFRGQYNDFASTFAHKVEPPYELKISSNRDIGILASKPWLHVADGNKLTDLNLDDLILEFHLETFTRWASKSSFSSIDTSGKLYTRSEAGDLTEIGIVRHHVGEARSNTILAYLQRRGKVIDSCTTHRPLAPGSLGKTIELQAEVRIPSNNEAYSRASGDFNPIHTSPLFAQIAGLPGTITHGMYCSAVVRQSLQKYAAAGHPSRIRKYEISFVGMVLPDDFLDVSLQHTGMQGGLMVYDISVSRAETGLPVIRGSALVAQPSTTIVFSGQGSQEIGMGMDLYASSPVARAIWDRADAYFISQFGLSILEIVRTNPKRLTVYFGGVRGLQLRHNYLSMYYETPSAAKEAGGKPQRRLVFPTITEQSTSYTHYSPHDLLFATQFSQPGLTIMEMAAFKDMQASGVVSNRIQFAGHSLGEYSALASITDFMPFESLMYLVFCRGMTMQGAVERDELGRSSFSMAAVDPSRVDSSQLHHIH